MLATSLKSKNALLVCALLSIATLIAFWPVTNSGFIDYDDHDYVTANPRVLSGLTWNGVVWAFVTSHASNWHPLTWLSHMLDVQLFGPGPLGPHCVNLGLHIANAILLFLLLRRMTGAFWECASVAGLFALHPLRVESVAWVSERKDVLSTFFWMLTLLAYTNYTRRLHTHRPKAVCFYVLAWVLFAFGLMSKPMLVTLPFVMLLFDVWPLQRTQLSTIVRSPSAVWPLVREKLPFFALTVLACGVTIVAQRQSIQPMGNLPFSDRLGNALISYARYLGKMFWPTDLVIPYPRASEWSWWLVLSAALALILITVAVLRAARPFPFLTTGWFFFLGTLVPVIGLLQVGTQAMADRYTYVPLIGVFIMIAWSVGEAVRRWHIQPPLLAAAAAGILATCALLTWRQAAYWRDSETLFRHSVEASTGNYVALTSIGLALYHQDRFAEAVDYYRKAYAINPKYPDVMNNLGVALAAMGDDEAIDWYRHALQVSPNHAGANYNLGNELLKRKQIAEAAACFETTLRMKPDHFEARNNLANVYADTGRLDEAIAHYLTALALQPRDVKVQRNLAAAFVKHGNYSRASELYRSALQIAPNDPGIHYAFGLVLALQGEWDDAILHYKKTLELLPEHAEAEYNLGYALRVQGQLDESAIHLRRALELRPDFPLAHYNLASVLSQLGQNQEAIIHLQVALRLDPTYDAAEKKLEELRLQSEPESAK